MKFRDFQVKALKLNPNVLEDWARFPNPGQLYASQPLMMLHALNSVIDVADTFRDLGKDAREFIPITEPNGAGVVFTPNPGETLWFYSRNRMRRGIVVSATKSRAQVAYTTEGARDEVARNMALYGHLYDVGLQDQNITMMHLPHNQLYTLK